MQAALLASKEEQAAKFACVHDNAATKAAKRNLYRTSAFFFAENDFCGERHSHAPGIGPFAATGRRLVRHLGAKAVECGRDDKRAGQQPAARVLLRRGGRHLRDLY